MSDPTVNDSDRKAAEEIAVKVLRTMFQMKGTKNWAIADSELIKCAAIIARHREEDGDSGVGLIAKARRKQIEKHGYDADHDDEYTNHQLSLAAIYYAMPDKLTLQTDNIIIGFCPEDFFAQTGWDWELFNNRTYKDDVERLAIAGALIAAEIDRLKRKEAAPCPK